MTRLGVPVPPGFTVTTEACNEYLAGNADDGIWQQLHEAVRQLEAVTGRRFGDADNPLLVSSRSGAKFSMPGMMDTVLNIGLNREITEKLAAGTMAPVLVWNLYRRLLQMYGEVVLGIDAEPFEERIRRQRVAAGVRSDAQLDAVAWQTLAREFEALILEKTGAPFPADVNEQLRAATAAVFDSWNGARAVSYRNAAGIPHDLGTAVNIQTMVFGNLDDRSGTGVCMSRSATTGEPELEGDYLASAQGEDVVAGIRATDPVASLGESMPELYEQLQDYAERLERHYGDMQDLEFTIEAGKLWILQARAGKRTAAATLRIAADLVDEGLIDKAEALRRVGCEHVDFFLHPQYDAEALTGAQPIAHGLNVSPGAAVGRVAMDADLAEEWAGDGEAVVLVRPETKPDDVHGMLAARGVLTHRGGRTSHAALVARQFGKPAVVGVEELDLDYDTRSLRFGDDTVVKEGEYLSLDGNTGTVYAGQLPTIPASLDDPYLLRILDWADEVRKLRVFTNADYGRDAARAREYGAEGVGLCRTEHMFFAAERLPIVQHMILAGDPEARAAAIEQLFPLQRSDFVELFRAMDGLPLTVRLLDPPLHEFLPSARELLVEIADLDPNDDDFASRRAELEQTLSRVDDLAESNPMLGTRGVRLGILVPELYRMQVRALIEAASECAQAGLNPRPEIMIPLVVDGRELEVVVEDLRKVAEVAAQGGNVSYRFGTMIELPRAALTAGRIAGTAEFFSFGTNDLTQTVFGISRDDAETSFLIHYLETGILPHNPFATIDEAGVGRLMAIAVEEARQVRDDLQVGICGEHGGDPASVALCHRLGIDYVSCSPERVPVARLAAAHAALAETDS
jgi:pyruvate,orthophosphate dikinase